MTLMNLIYFAVSEYTRVTSGPFCQRITSKTECEEAAKELGLSGTEAEEETVSDWPPNCYFSTDGDGAGLWFNNDGDSAEHCDRNQICICKK